MALENNKSCGSINTEAAGVTHDILKEGAWGVLSETKTSLTDTTAFKAWFKDSKVVDDNGKPLMVFHGTNKNFSNFDHKTKSTKTGNPNAQLGFFFSDMPHEASRYASGWGKMSGGVMPVYLKITNPYKMPYKEFDDLAMATYRSLQSEPDYDPDATLKFGDEKGQRDAIKKLQKHRRIAEEHAAFRRDELIDQGYDGIVVKIGGGREFIAFNANQIKSSIGNNGKFDMKSMDIGESKSVAPSPTGTSAFKAWFKKSKVVDSKGDPMPVYHGSGTKISKFSYEFANKGNDQIGSGFYFTTNEDQAHGYTTNRLDSSTPKLGGEDVPTVHSVYLSLQNPLDATKTGKISRSKLEKIIKAAPDLYDRMTDWVDVESEGMQAGINMAVNTYVGMDDSIIKLLNNIANTFYPDNAREFNEVIYKVLGYDGVYEDYSSGVTHWVAWFPRQIKSIDNPGTFKDDSDDINEVIATNSSYTNSPEFKAWFGTSK